VHTVTIRSDQQGGRNPAASGSRKSNAKAAQPKGDQPLSIMPGSQGAAAGAPPVPERAQTGAAPMTVASATPDSGNAAAAPSGGGYAVQVTSQRSEAEAKSAFRSLQAKYPSQLGNREPIVHRADLGAKGTYYRALVGPFASAEAAAEMCSSLKAAGGSCLVQRN
jgi:cell division septation protein DedD